MHTGLAVVRVQAHRIIAHRRTGQNHSSAGRATTMIVLKVSTSTSRGAESASVRTLDIGLHEKGSTSAERELGRY